MSGEADDPVVSKLTMTERVNTSIWEVTENKQFFLLIEEDIRLLLCVEIVEKLLNVQTAIYLLHIIVLKINWNVITVGMKKKQ